MTAGALPSRHVIASLLTASVAVAILGGTWTVAHGPAGPLYLIVYAVIVLPGLPLGFRLFGRHHLAGWVSGVAFGYALAVLAFWAVIKVNAPTATGFVVALAICGCGTWLLNRRRPSAIALPPWTAPATASLSAVMILTLVLVVWPLARIGERDTQGSLRYRAYFTADFVWHTALTTELAHFTLPPRNPYLAPAPMHYYWGYFLIPAVVAQAGPGPLGHVELCLKLNGMITGLLLMASLFTAAFAAVPHAIAAGAGTSLALAASSLEGSYALWRVWTRHAPWVALRDMNVDAVAAWYFQGHRIDGLQRCLWYVPQHGMAYALGLTALAAVMTVGSMGSLACILLAGIALAGATMLNPFVGAVFAVVWGSAIAIDAVRRRERVGRRIATHAVAAVPVAMALAWCIGNRMVEGAGGTLELGFTGSSISTLAITLMLSCGPILIAAAAGLAVTGPPRSPIVPAVLLAGLSLVLMYFVRLSVDHEWIPFRAGHMLLAAGAVLATRWLAGRGPRPGRHVTCAIVTLLAILALPTTIIDAYNAQDVENTRPGPGFRWTLVLSPEQQEAFDWIRTETPGNAVVQMEPIVRERDSWSLIPSFAQRRMAAGLPISLLSIPAYRERSAQVETLFKTKDAAEASRLAHKLHIRYLYVDGTDRKEYEGTIKFDQSPRHFTPVFRRGEVGVYELR